MNALTITELVIFKNTAKGTAHHRPFYSNPTVLRETANIVPIERSERVSGTLVFKGKVNATFTMDGVLTIADLGGEVFAMLAR